MLQNKKTIIIIGAGASGLAAACAAAGADTAVTLIEKNHVPGRKLLSTGAGKCNLSNAHIGPGNYHGDPSFISKALKTLPPEDVRSFFKDLGLLTVEDAEGRIFPRTMKAADVVGSLTNRVQETGGEILTLNEACSIRKIENGFDVTVRKVAPQWEPRTNPGPERHLLADAVIIAAGGPTYPQIGGSLKGYTLAKALGHTVREPRPIIVPLNIKDAHTKRLNGIRVQAEAALLSGNRLIEKKRGELLFTEYGVSGPVVLDLSRRAVFNLPSDTSLRVDLFPDLSEKELLTLLLARKARMPERPWESFTCGLCDAGIAALFSELSGLKPDVPAGKAEEKAFNSFRRLLKDFRLQVSAPLEWKDAMAAAGGVATEEMDPATFASRRVRGLYITGELLDIDGDCGGYNLHFAWTSGLLAGRNAAKQRRS